MQVVSLVPAATEWIAAFDAADLLIGRSHACDAPPSVRGLPVLTRLAAPVGGGASEIDAAVRAASGAGHSLYRLDAELLASLQPDLVVVQDQCGVCAVSPQDLAPVLAHGVELLPFSPLTFKQVLDAALGLGRRLGRLPRAMACIAEHERSLHALRERLGARRDGSLRDRRPPRVACVEWVDPLMTAGHWAPDLVELAGGEAVCTEGGVPSRYVGCEEIAAADPDVVVVAACGRSVRQSLKDLEAMADHSVWRSLRAVREGRVYALDGDAYLNRPGPRLYRTVELLAAILHPDRVAGTYSTDEVLRIDERVLA